MTYSLALRGFFLPALWAGLETGPRLTITASLRTQEPMNALAWLVRIVFFLVVLWFAFKNLTPVPLHLTESWHWEGVPLIFVMLACLLVGVIAGAVAMAPKVFRLRRMVAAHEAKAAQAPPTIRRGPETISGVVNVARNAGAVGELDSDTRIRD